jgi:hypothetical protein
MMRFAIVVAGLSAMLLAAGSAMAADVPKARIVRDADAICSLENGRLAQVKNPPKYASAKDITPARLRLWAPWFKRWAALKRDESKRIGALGSPREPAARSAWRRWKMLVATVQVPAFANAATAASHGDVKRFTTAFGAAGRSDSEANKVAKLLGFHVCSWDG